jgi:hypothetical protein
MVPRDADGLQVVGLQRWLGLAGALRVLALGAMLDAIELHLEAVELVVAL